MPKVKVPVSTPFEQAQVAALAGTLKTPSVSTSGGAIDYFGYQVSVHVYNLSIMAAGMKFRGIKFTDIKKYYGLTGKSAKDCVPQLKAIADKYRADLAERRNQATNN